MQTTNTGLTHYVGDDCFGHHYGDIKYIAGESPLPSEGPIETMEYPKAHLTPEEAEWLREKKEFNDRMRRKGI